MAFDTIEAGTVFGLLTAIEPIRKTRGKMYWRFKCACGDEIISRSQSAKIGKLKSCGCRGVRSASPGNKVCRKCLVEKPLTDFTIRKNGTPWGRCKQCSYVRHCEYSRERYKTDPSFVKALAANQVRLRSMPGTRIGVMWRTLKTGAKSRNIPFSIEKTDIAMLAERQQWRCAKTGLPLDLTMGKGQLPFGPTIDRIDNDRGYEPNNIQLVCYLYNVAKNRFTDADVFKFAEALVGTSQTKQLLRSVA